MTPADLRKRAQKAAELADALERVMAVLDSLDLPAAARKRAMGAAESLMGEAMGLLSRSEDSTMGTMDTSPEPMRAVRGPKFRSRHAIVKRAKERGYSVPKLCAELEGVLKRKFPRTTVRSWYARDPDGRPIPRDAADYLSRDPWNIPLDSRPHGVAE